ncbi:hypothetical protein Dimus_022741, partial [Dionaea muscipula]
ACAVRGWVHGAYAGPPRVGCDTEAIHGILGEKSMLVAVGETHKRLRSVALSLVNTIKANPDFLSDIETPAIQILESWKDKRGVIFCDEARKVH